MSDVDMGSGFHPDVLVRNAPAMPKAPLFKGETMEERRRFMRDYQVYLDQCMALQTGGAAPFVMPVSACIDYATKKHIALWVFHKSHPTTVSEDAWVSWFKEAYDVPPVDLDVLKARIRNVVVFCPRVRDLDSRIMRMLGELTRALEDDYQLWVLEDEGRMVVDIILDAIKPVGLQRSVKEHMKLTKNKPVRSDLFRFIDWFRDYARQYELIVGHVGDSPLVSSPADRPRDASFRGQSRPSAPARSPAPSRRDRSDLGRAGSDPNRTRWSEHDRGQRPDWGRREPRLGTEHRPPPFEADRRGAASGLACLKCRSTSHQVRECPRVRPGEASSLIAGHFQAARSSPVRRVQSESGNATVRLGQRPSPSRPQFGNVRTVRLHQPTTASEGTDQSTAATPTSVPDTPEDGPGYPEPTVAIIEDAVRLDTVVWDTGADASLVDAGVLALLSAVDVTPTVRTDAQRSFQPYGMASQPVVMTRLVTFKRITFETIDGPISLVNVAFWVNDTAPTGHDMILGEPLMRELGFSASALLRTARASSQVWDFSRLPPPAHPLAPDATPLARACTLTALAIDDCAVGDEDLRCATPALVSGGTTADRQAAVWQVLEDRIGDAAREGLDASGVEQLRTLLLRFVDVFRLELGRDPPVAVEPLKVRLKPDAVPVKSPMRRYPPLHVEFMRKHVAELEAVGAVYKNNRARWAAAPRIVPKKDPSDLRMTIDSRPINACTEPMPWPMPNLDAALATLAGTRVYFSLDWLKGYWQLALHPSCQELFSFMTPFGVYTPTRVLMGQSDAVAYCQYVENELFGELLMNGLLAWLDDLLGYATDAPALFGILEAVLEICARSGLKLHPKKCRFYETSTKWCGKIISANGISHCPERLQGLLELPPPATAADLQQLLCAVNWMRSSIPDYAALVAPLGQLLDVAARSVGGSRKKTVLARVSLASVGWSANHASTFELVKRALLSMVPMGHPQPDKQVCVFTDASEYHWGVIVTQIPHGDVSRAFSDQRHEFLAAASGDFSGAAARWSIVEKEAYAAFFGVERHNYLVVRPEPFLLYVDSTAVAFMNDPYASASTVAKHTANKVFRWSLALSTYNYAIAAIPGDVNVWADLLSRWGSPVTAAIKSHIYRLMSVSPLQDSAFDWPSPDEIAAVQLSVLSGGTPPPGVVFDEPKSIYVVDRLDRPLWIPDEAVDLQQRLCVVAHAGIAGHRGVEATTTSIKRTAWWSTIKADVERFLESCLHCMKVRGKLVPRPYGAALHAEGPNELLHFDWLALPTAYNRMSYVLVLKDDMSGFCVLHPSEAATASETAKALMNWFSMFGVVNTWVSDCGSHFKNLIIEELSKLVGAHHHFVTPYCPWANGTVEVVNASVLRMLKALGSELRLRPDRWPDLLPLVQSAINHMPADRSAGQSPSAVFTSGRDCTPLSALVATVDIREESVEAIKAIQAEHAQKVRAALKVMHKDVAAAAEHRRTRARDRRGKKTHVRLPTFSLGDFVLVGRVAQAPNKLTLHWTGPARIVAVINDYLFEVQQLVEPYGTSKHHASRLQMYHEGGRDVTVDLVEHIAFGDDGFYVDKLADARSVNGTWQVLVHWMGLEAAEASWEPALDMYADVPVLFRRWARSAHAPPLVADMVHAMERVLGHSL